jgi:hypothetical protein
MSFSDDDSDDPKATKRPKRKPSIPKVSPGDTIKVKTVPVARDARIIGNRQRRMIRHLCNHPLDQQARKTYEGKGFPPRVFSLTARGEKRLRRA